MEPRTYDILYSSFNATFMGLLGMGPRRSSIVVTDDVVEVRMGWGFHTRIPRRSITGVSRDTDRVLGWGVHGWNGRWLVNGSSDGLVRITIDPRVPARVIGIRVSPSVLRVSVVDADGLIAELSPSAG